MTTSNHTTTFWEFLGNNSVEIPIIQRDYAQGRIGKENLRKNFLKDIKAALDNNKELKLDFVYGSIENGRLFPLDGQQRLTTLWLIHWYIALRADKLYEAQNRLRKFSYETRISSRIFCEELCNSKHFEGFKMTNNIVEFITNQTWFYSTWKQDPTIQSMLRMLGGKNNSRDEADGIEKVFDCDCCIKNKGFEEEYVLSDGEKCSGFIYYYNLLTGGDCPIVFYYLSKDFGNSDNLYVKMNARGEQLTCFENLKADLIGYITEQSKNELFEKTECDKWESLLHPETSIPIKLDTKWTDMFWEYRSVGIKNAEGIIFKANQIDEIYFSFLNRFFWNELFIAKEVKDGVSGFVLDIGKGDESSTQENNNSSYKYLNDSDNSKDYDIRIAYNMGLDVYKYYHGLIPREFFEKLEKTLDNVSKYLENKYTIPMCTWDDSFRFIPEYVKNDSGDNIEISNNSSDIILKVTALTQVQRIAFFAICKYFQEGEGDEKTLKRWMRVVWNLISSDGPDGRPQIRSTQAMRTAIDFIGGLNSHMVYESLKEKDLVENDKLSDFNNRRNEEIIKAEKILRFETRSDGKSWEDVITEAEESAFFKGRIRFLFMNEYGIPVWDDFDRKYKNAKKYFDKSGVIDIYKIQITKALIMQCDDWDKQVYNKQIFNTNSTVWNGILSSPDYYRPIHNILIEDNLSDVPHVEFNEPYNRFIKKELLPYENMVISNPLGRFRWKHNERLGYYKPYGKDAIAFDWDNFQRNSIMTELCDSRLISTEQRIGKTCFYDGWDIDFVYKKKVFRWCSNNNYIYLMMEGDYCPKDSNGGLEEEKFYCFNAAQHDARTIVSSMESILEEQNRKEDCL